MTKTGEINYNYEFESRASSKKEEGLLPFSVIVSVQLKCQHSKNFLYFPYSESYGHLLMFISPNNAATFQHPVHEASR